MTDVDLTNCDREPIHIPGAIQAHGVLLACQGDPLIVTQVSENVGEFLGLSPAAALGRPLSAFFTADSAQRLETAQRAGFPREDNPIPVVSSAGATFDAIVHVSTTGQTAIVELEPRRHDSAGFHPRMRSIVRRLQEARDQQVLTTTAAREVRDLTGFDRVMVYRFDADWHGHVVAEAKLERLEPFLGLHYPAADIPVQARRLYTLNWLRIIPDIGYRPARLVPPLDPDSDTPLDLSFSVLRSVSPIHVEYLQNMGVTASMSVSLVRDGQLIGLIACHHYSGSHHVPFAVRETAEYLGQVLSWHLTALEATEAAERALETQRAESRLASLMATARTVGEGLADVALLNLTGATGAAVVFEGRVYEVGATPGPGRVRQITKWLSASASPTVLQTEALHELLPEATGWDDTASGLLAVEIARELGEYVLWFRPSTERTVDWAGDPRKQEAPDPLTGIPRLSPRGSFALWREVVRGRSLPWETWQVQGASGLRRLLLGTLRARAHDLRNLNEQLAAADRSKDEFLSTISHELRTPLNAVIGWVHMLRSAHLPADRVEHALQTIERNAQSQRQLIDDMLDVSRIMTGKLALNVEPVVIAAVVEHTIETARLAAEAKDIRLRATLDSSAMVMGDVQRLQQVFGNLLMNAVKFTPKGGRVDALVTRTESSVEFSVTDNGQGISPEFLPHVFERFRQEDASATRKSGGLGLGLAIVRHLTELHGGTVDAASGGPGAGATFTVRLPISIVARRGAGVTPQHVKRGIECPPQIAGLRILIVDDEADARELLQALLEECQATVVTADSAEAGLRVLKTAPPDIIVSDIGMPEHDGYWFISQVRARPADEGGRTPAVALTAYTRAEDRMRALLAGFQSHVPKPVEPMELLAVLATLTRDIAGRS